MCKGIRGQVSINQPLIKTKLILTQHSVDTHSTLDRHVSQQSLKSMHDLFILAFFKPKVYKALL